jgi:hypothetical protein
MGLVTFILRWWAKMDDTSEQKFSRYFFAGLGMLLMTVAGEPALPAIARAQFDSAFCIYVAAFFLGLIFFVFGFGWPQIQPLLWPNFSFVWLCRKYGKPHPMSSLVIVSTIGALIGALFLGGSWWLLSRLESRASATISKGDTASENVPHHVTLKQLFENGWPDLPAYYNVSTLQAQANPPKPEIKLAWRLNGDFSAMSKFLEFFLERALPPKDALDICVFIADHYQDFIDTANSEVDIAGRWPTDTSATHLKDMVFSKRIFIYYENPDFSLEQKGSLEVLYKQKGLSISFRGAEYAWLHREDHPPFRPQPLTPNSILLPRATGSGLEISAMKLSP